MDEKEREKEKNDLVVEAIFNGVPVILDVCGIEAFNSSDVFSYLREGSETSYHTSEYDEKNLKRAREFSEEELKNGIESVLNVFVKAGIFIHNPGSEYGDFDPTEIAFEIRKYFINGEKF